MSRTGCLDPPVIVPAKRTELPPAIKVLVAFFVGLALLSPAVLGLYWEMLLPK